jgi:hypothetical protein
VTLTVLAPQAFPLMVSLPRVSVLASTHKQPTMLKHKWHHYSGPSSKAWRRLFYTDTVLQQSMQHHASSFKLDAAAHQQAMMVHTHHDSMHEKATTQLGAQQPGREQQQPGREQQQPGREQQQPGREQQQPGRRLGIQLGTNAARVDPLVELTVHKINATLTKSW